jgi:hypothetical protein
MLPKLEILRRNDSPMFFEELSAVSKSLASLSCSKGFNFFTAQVDISSLIFSRMERVEVLSEKDKDFQFVVNIGGGLSEEVKEVLKGLGVTVD